MIDSTFSRATWLNSLHMSTLTLSLLEKEGFAREQLLEGSGITPADLLDLRRLISPWQEQQVFANACRLSDEPALGLRLGLRTRISAYGLLVRESEINQKGKARKLWDIEEGKGI